MTATCRPKPRQKQVLYSQNNQHIYKEPYIFYGCPYILKCKDIRKKHKAFRIFCYFLHRRMKGDY